MMLTFSQFLGQVPPQGDAANVFLNAHQRSVCRQAVELSDGQVAGLMLPRGTVLHEGDVLATSNGEQVVVHCALEELIEATAPNVFCWGQACYHLGNRHLPLELELGKVRFLPDPVIEELCHKLGLTTRTVHMPFRPEAGAYASHSHNHGHSHDHDHAHDHAPEHSHGYVHHHGHRHDHDHDHGAAEPAAITEIVAASSATEPVRL